MNINKISIIIPCYNEIKTIEKIINEVKNYKNFDKEIIIIDDGSTDGTRKFLDSINENDIRILLNDKNYGKGKAIRRGFEVITGDVVIIQDADLEYSPNDYDILLRPFIEADADIVYGSRFLGGSRYLRLHYFSHYIANKLLTFICNIFTNLNMTDMETGFKVFTKKAIKSINLKENSFGIEPEITVKLAKKKFKFFEVSIGYNGRSYEEGKKITLKDAFKALYCIVKYKFFD